MPQTGRQYLWSRRGEPTPESLAKAMEIDLLALSASAEAASPDDSDDSIRYVLQEAATWATKCFQIQDPTPLRKLQAGIAHVFMSHSAIPQLERAPVMAAAASRVQSFLVNLKSFDHALAGSVPPIGARAILLRGQRPDVQAWEDSLRKSDSLLFFGKDSGGLFRVEGRPKLFLDKLQSRDRRPEIAIYLLAEGSAYYTQGLRGPRAAVFQRELESRSKTLHILMDIKNALPPGEIRDRLRVYEYDDPTNEMISFTRFHGGNAEERVLFAEYHDAVESPDTIELEFDPAKLIGRTINKAFEDKLNEIQPQEIK
jgi:hypothetical protein